MKYRQKFFTGALLFGALALSSFSQSALAQEKKEAPQRDVKVVPSQEPTEEPKAPLPKIENPEFVITGHETMELPEAAKSDAEDARSFVPPLPTPGLKQSDVARTAMKQTLQSKMQPGMTAKVYGAFGNFMTPEIGAWFGKTFTQGSIAVNGRYRSTDGFEKNTQRMEAGLGLAGSYKFGESNDVLSENRLRGEFGVGTDEYRPYGSMTPSEKRVHNNFDLGVGFDARTTTAHPSFAPIDYSLHAAFNRTSLAGHLSDYVENEFAFSSSASSLYESTPVNASLEYRLSTSTTPMAVLQEMHWLDASAGARLQALENLQFTLGAAFYLYRGNEGATSGRLYPRIGVRWFAVPELSLYAAYEPDVVRTSFRSVLRENPYIALPPELLPSDETMRFRMGADLVPFDRATFSVKYEYRAVNNYQSFLDTNYIRLWTPVYVSDILAMKTDLRLRYTISQLDEATVFAAFTTVRRRGSSLMMPFVPRENAGVIFRHWFQSNISAEATAEYVGRRFTDPDATQRNPAYVNASLRAEYALVRNLKFTAEVQNLFDQKYYIWNGYQERPLFVSFGINYLW
ncbi:MAG TPA: TonB-dependent receptor [Bacteroidota bacterium]|nr:TonB-dependent receptor [Bacteroidota bacterium]